MKSSKKRSIILILCLSLVLSQWIPVLGIGDGQGYSIFSATTSTFSKTAANLSIKKRSYASLSLSWTKVKGATGYDVYRATSSKGKYTKIKRTTGNSLISSSLKTNKAYYYKVRAYRSVGSKTTYGNYSAYKRGVPIPATPTNVSAPQYNALNIKITWNSCISISGYEVYRATSRSGTYSRRISTTSRSYLNSAITTGKSYYYKVRAYKVIKGKRVYGSFSTPILAKAVPSRTSVTATALDTTRVKLSWKAMTGASGYEVYRAASGGTYARVLSTTSKTFTNGPLTPGRTYYYKVRAYRTVNGKRVYGSFSTSVSATPSLLKPTATATVAGFHSVKLSWGSVGYASGYEIYRGTTASGTYTKVKTTTERTYTNTGLTSGKKYYYKVRAYKAVNGGKVYGSFSTVVSSTLSKNVTTVVASAVDIFSIKVSWSQISGVAGYEVYRGSTANGNYEKLKATTENTLTDDGIAGEATYYYKVRPYMVINGTNVYGQFSDPVSATTALAKPIVTVAPRDFYTVDVSWQEVKDANGYDIYRSESVDGTYDLVGTKQSPTKSLTDAGREAGKTYYYKVKAFVTVDGNKIYSEFSQPVSATTLKNKTTATVKTVGPTSVGLSWLEIPGVSGYEVHSATTPEGEYTRITTTGNNTFTNSQLTTGKTYYYKVRPYKRTDGFSVFGNFSEPVSATPNLAKIIAAAKAIGGTSVEVSWEKVDGAISYEIQRGTSLDGQYETLEFTDGTTFTDIDLDTGKTYFYKVRACGSSGSITVFGEFSEPVSATPFLEKVSATATVIDSSRIKLSWEKITGATGYEIQRGTSVDGEYTTVKTIAEEVFTDEALTTGQNYYYKVRAYRDVNGEKVYGEFSSIVSGRPATLSVNIQDLNVKAGHKITLGIESNEFNGSSFEYYVSINGAAYTRISTTTDVAKRVTYTVSHDKTYQFKVRGSKEVSGTTNSTYSGSISYKCEWIHPGKWYKVGEDIPAGTYYFQFEPKSNSSLGSYSLYTKLNNESSLFLFEFVGTTRYQQLEEGEYLVLEESRCIGVNKVRAPKWNGQGKLTEAGMYEVGKDIPAGYYTATGTDSAMFGTVSVYKNCRKDINKNWQSAGYDITIDVQDFDGNRYMKEGYFVEINGATLTYKGKQ